MAFYYRNLLSFKFNSLYYGEGKEYGGLEIEPAADEQLLSGLGLIFRKETDGFRLFYRATNEAGAIKPIFPVKDLPEDFVLPFRFRINDPFFWNHSETGATLLPLGLKNTVLFFDSKAISTTKDILDNFVEKAVLSNPEFLEMKASEFNWEFTLAGNPASGEAAVYNDKGQQVRRYTVWLNIDSNSYFANISLDKLPEGRYELRCFNAGTEEGTAQKFWLRTTQESGKNMGILWLRKKDFWRELQVWNEGDKKNDRCKYSYSFANKKAQWLYRVVFKYTKAPANAAEVLLYSLEDKFAKKNRYNPAANPADKFFFSAPVQSTLNGYTSIDFKSTAIDLVSDKEFPLFSDPKLDLELRKSGVLFRPDLPGPDIGNQKNEIILYV